MIGGLLYVVCDDILDSLSKINPWTFAASAVSFWILPISMFV